MSYLLFWQDTIDHCQSADINETLLDHFQVLFLEQLLYPSLLESSDVEGGSTSAVLTYLCQILESLEQPDLVSRILQFLLQASPSGVVNTQPVSLSRRRSIDALNALAATESPSPSLFNLRDLTLLGLRSSGEHTVLATLRLVAIVLHYHPAFANLLIRTVAGRPAKQRTVGAINVELTHNLLPTFIVINDPNSLDISYENYIQDASWTIESRLLHYSSEDDCYPPALQLRLLDDPIIHQLLTCLKTFFTNSVAVNLSLTEVLVSIASSPLISLDGWLLVDPEKYQYPSSPSDLREQQSTKNNGDDVLHQIRLAYQIPRWRTDQDIPLLTGMLQKLVGKVEEWRRDVADFDILIAARRDVLQDSPPAIETATMMMMDSPTTRSTLPASPDNVQPHHLTPTTTTIMNGSTTPQAFQTLSSSKLSQTHEQLRTRLEAPFHQQKEYDGDEGKRVVEATLGHVLTNIVILHEFLLELSAVVQVRGILLGEAGYPDLENS